MTRATLFAFFIVAVPAFARLGETPKQVENRYGPPGAERTTMLTAQDTTLFTTNEFTIGVCFSNGVSVAEFYVPKNGKLDKDTLQMLLARHAEASDWDEGETDTPGYRVWKRRDNQAMAAHHQVHNSLLVCNIAFWKSFMAQLHQEKLDRIKGF